MAKVKTQKSVSKRIKITSSGKLLRGHSYASHLKTKKSKSRIRRQKELVTLIPGDKKRVKKLLA